MLFCYLERLKARTEREWAAAEKLFHHLHWQRKRKAARIQSLCKHSACLALSDNRKQSQRGEAHECTLPSAPLPSFQRAPSVTWQGSTSWQMSRGSLRGHSILLPLLRNQPRAASHDSKGQISSAFGVPQVLELNNHRFSEQLHLRWNDFLPGKNKNKFIDLVKQNLLAETYWLGWNISWKPSKAGLSNDEIMLGERKPLQNIQATRK